MDIKDGLLLALILLVMFLIPALLFSETRFLSLRKEYRQAARRYRQNITDRDWMLKANLLAKELSRASSEKEMKYLLMELGQHFPGKIKVVVSENGEVLDRYTRIPPVWGLDFMKSPVPPSERWCIHEEEGIRVRIESNRPFCEDNNPRNLWLVKLLAGAIWDNARNTKQERLLSAEVKFDALTGLLNQKGFKDRFDEEVEEATRYLHDLTVAVVDLNSFKLLNDEFGHDVGNEFLKAVAEAIKKEDRWEDVSARWGGDEFVLIFPHTDEKGAKSALVRIKKRICQIAIEAAPGVKIGVAVGVASLKKAENYRRAHGLEPTERADTLFRLADEAMYISKQMPRHGIVIWRAPRE